MTAGSALHVITPARTTADFTDGHALLMRMAEWDIDSTRAAGFSTDGLLETIYGEGPEALYHRFTAPGAAMLLARRDEHSPIVGCICYATEEQAIAEIAKFFVAPESRGLGVGRALITTALERLDDAGVKHVRLETVSFMKEAIALYRRFGFRDCPAFHPVLPTLAAITIFMERSSGSADAPSP